MLLRSHCRVTGITSGVCGAYDICELAAARPGQSGSQAEALARRISPSLQLIHPCLMARQVEMIDINKLAQSHCALAYATALL